MYNRYIQNDDGIYEYSGHQEDTAPPPPPWEEWQAAGGTRSGFLDQILEKLHLGDIDKGDILLLLILLFLYDQGGDEELLMALGLLFLL